MDEKKFWAIIDKVNLKVTSNSQTEILQETLKELIKLKPKDILIWDKIRSTYSEAAYRNDLWAACAATHSHSTDDGFLDFRSWLISKGEKVYMNALNDPDSLADLDIPMGSANFETFAYVAAEAYSQKMMILNEDLKNILANYYVWLEKNSKTLLSNYYRNSSKEEKADGLTEDYINEIVESKYDFYSEKRKCKIPDKCYKKIMSEIPKKPDIDANWNMTDLPNIVPKLCKKYTIQECDNTMQPSY